MEVRDVWYVDPGKGATDNDTYELRSPFDGSISPDNLITKAVPFTVRFLTLVVNNNYSTGFINGLTRRERTGNDILIRSFSSMGNQTRVERVHFYEDDVLPGRVIDSPQLRGISTVFVCEDYDGESSLGLELDISEIDVRENDSKAIQGGIASLAAAAGALYPQLLPFTPLGPVIVKTWDTIRSAITDNDEIIKKQIEFSSLNREGYIPLRAGRYIFFKKKVNGDEYIYKNGEIIRKDGKSMNHTSKSKQDGTDYAVLLIEKGAFPSRQEVITQEVAGIITLMNTPKPNGVVNILDIVTETMRAQKTLEGVMRVQELENKSTSGTALSDAEKALLEKLRKQPEISTILK